MKPKNYLVPELLLVAALLGFIVWICILNSGGTQKSIEEVSAPVCLVLTDGQMNKKTNTDAIKSFGIDLDKTEGLVYYANDSVMDVSEMLIVKLVSADDAQEFRTAIQNRVTDQENLYKNYAPDQYALLEDCIIKTSGNTVFYCTAKNADELYEAYKKAL
ncbi:MAG: DUF4358 domain-containing protein [Clostridiales bacterium]|nr:DUF4358 domain-containing protein [Clostridiales bacterium]